MCIGVLFSEPKSHIQELGTWGAWSKDWTTHSQLLTALQHQVLQLTCGDGEDWIRVTSIGSQHQLACVQLETVSALEQGTGLISLLVNIATVPRGGWGGWGWRWKVKKMQGHASLAHKRSLTGSPKIRLHQALPSANKQGKPHLKNPVLSKAHFLSSVPMELGHYFSRQYSSV